MEELKAPRLDYGIFDKEKRFLVKALRMALQCRVISNADKLRAFPLTAIAEGYDLEDELMAYVLGMLFPHLGKATIKYLIERGHHTDLIQSALDARDVTEDNLFAVIPEEEVVRVLDNTTAWRLIDDTKWYEKDTSEHRAFAAYLLEQYLEECLGGNDEARWSTLVDHIGVDQLVLDAVPHTMRTALLKSAYKLGGQGKPTTAQVLLTVFPPKHMVKHIPLPVLARPLHAAAVTFGWMDAASIPAVAPAALDDDGETTDGDGNGASDKPAAGGAAGDSDGDDDEDRPTGLPPRDPAAPASGPPPLPTARAKLIAAGDEDADVERSIEERLNAIIQKDAPPGAEQPSTSTEGRETGEAVRIDLSEFEEDVDENNK